MRWILTIIIFIIALILLTPLAMSTDIGKNFINQRIAKQMDAQVELDQIRLSWLGPQKLTGLKLSNPRIDLTAEEITLNLPIWSALSIRLEKLLTFRPPGEIINFNAKIHDASIIAEYNSVNGQSKVNGKTTKFFLNGKTKEAQKEGKFSLDSTVVDDDGETSIIADIKVTSFPTIGLDKFLSLLNPKNKKLLVGIFGEEINSIAQVNYSTKKEGTLDITLNSPNISLVLDAALKEKTITLHKTLNLSINLTKGLGDFLLSKASDSDIKSIESLSPIKITVETDGFSLPFDTAFNLKTLKIGRALVDFGKIKVENGSNLASLISLMKFGSLSPLKETTIWCTPINIELKNGVVRTDRMDLLIADALRVCIWGKADLNKDRLDMTLGILGTSLKNSFTISGIPDDYVMTVPMGGSLKHIKIKKDVASKKIAALMGGSVAGGFVGLPTAKVGMESQKKIPPPKKPYPWGEDKSKSSIIPKVKVPKPQNILKVF